MNLPAIFFGILLATGLGAAYHLLRGGALSRLVLYLLTSWIGFAAGHYAGAWLQLTFLRLGAINMFAAALGSILALVLAEIMAPASKPDKGNRPPGTPTIHPQT